VQVFSDPVVQRNTHEIQVKWQFGEMFLRFANDPHPQNPHTSALAAWSAIKLLQTLLEVYRVLFCHFWERIVVYTTKR